MDVKLMTTDELRKLWADTHKELSLRSIETRSRESEAMIGKCFADTMGLSDTETWKTYSKVVGVSEVGNPLVFFCEKNVSGEYTFATRDSYGSGLVKEIPHAEWTTAVLSFLVDLKGVVNNAIEVG